MGILDNLNPERVFHYFEELSAIPRGSRNTKRASDYVVAFAAAQGLRHRQDALGNVIIWKDGSAGCEDKPAVMLQGHLDMVCEKDAACQKDMNTEPIELEIKDDFLSAKGTTLGGDDGIAVAMTLAILEDKSLVHPPLEAVFTVDEEIGLLGAARLDTSDLKSRFMLNIDSEEEGVFTVGCAGGAEGKCVLPVSYENNEGPVFNLMVSGLTGGHSGVEISKNRANAYVLLGRCLWAIASKYKFRLLEIKGGGKSNAIAVAASAQLMLVNVKDDEIKDTSAAVVKIITDMTNAFKGEFKTTDPGLMIVCRPVFKSMKGTNDRERFVFDSKTLSGDSTDRVIYILNCLPNGIQRRNPTNPLFIQTSLNLGIVEKNDRAVVFTYCLRSSVKSELDNLQERLRMGMRIAGGDVMFMGIYPGWEYNPQSVLKDICRSVYKRLYEKEPVVESIHAGLECGYFVSRIPDLDCISYGPDIQEIHTPRERMSISSVERVYNMTIEILKELARSE